MTSRSLKGVARLNRRDVCAIFGVPPWFIGPSTTWRDRLWWYSSPKRWFWRRAS